MPLTFMTVTAAPEDEGNLVFHANATSPSWQVCVAPMIDVTDRHCRYFHRLLHPRARLYTEMITTGALRHGDAARHLQHDAAEHPVALQLGGCDPAELAHAARLGAQWGYDEINLNCGCPSDRVQQGAFGACLMAQPNLVADGVKAMRDAVDVPVTVKHRLGLDHDTSYGFVRDFVGALRRAGCDTFIVHARNAVLRGLSPKDNRSIPPLRYDDAARLKQDFPDARFILNGGIATVAQAQTQLRRFDGVMLGRAAWHDPGILTALARALASDHPLPTPEDVVQSMTRYAEAALAQGVPLRVIVKPMLGWMRGRPGARRWRQRLSDASLLASGDAGLIGRVWQECAGNHC